MDNKKRWADYSDSENSCDEESVSTASVLEPLEVLDSEDFGEFPKVPYFLKIINFPFKATESEVASFLALGSSDLANLHLLYSKGKKSKFRGIAVFKVTRWDVGKYILQSHGRTFADRQISVEVMKEWIGPSKPKGKRKKRRPTMMCNSSSCSTISSSASYSVTK